MLPPVKQATLSLLFNYKEENLPLTDKMEDVEQFHGHKLELAKPPSLPFMIHTNCREVFLI